MLFLVVFSLKSIHGRLPDAAYACGLGDPCVIDFLACYNIDVVNAAVNMVIWRGLDEDNAQHAVFCKISNVFCDTIGKSVRFVFFFVGTDLLFHCLIDRICIRRLDQKLGEVVFVSFIDPLLFLFVIVILILELNDFIFNIILFVTDCCSGLGCLCCCGLYCSCFGCFGRLGSCRFRHFGGFSDQCRLSL